MNLRRIISVVLAIMMVATIIPFATISSSAAVANKYETAAHEIDSKYRYDQTDLGATYTPEQTTFKVWAPTATKCVLNLYATGTDEEPGAQLLSKSEMTYDETTGVWSTILEGDQKNVYYTYTITAKSIATDTVTTKETVDVYSVATGAKGQRSMVCDLDSTDPEGWEDDKHVITEDQSDASIWEIHVKDFSYAENSGVSKDNRGKFLAFTETGTTLNGEGDVSTCIDYLKELGVTYVQINPFYDFGSVDETGSDSQFNWGYDPMNYNVPEGSYSTDPYNGNTRIKECKQMIQALHNAGIGVIMDVVYNHTYNTSTSFQACVPDYYYRKTASGAFSSGSGCGNDTASERAMFRNFMVQSTKYWAEEYHVDGFRFDLMGLHDNATMNAIRQSLDTIDAGMIMYGEGWSMSSTHDIVDCDGETVVMCNQTSTKLIDPRIGMFNDQFRDSMKGSYATATAKGYIQGNIIGNSKGVKYGFRANAVGGSCNWKAMNPGQCVNYMSCHDNNTLYDKLGVSVNGSNVVYRQRDDKLIHLNKFAETIAATSQGMHFMLAGEEMARSKDGDDNSYKSAATENMIDWEEIVKNADLVSYYRGMMDIRKAFSPFTTDDVEVSKNQYKISSALTTDDRAFAFTIANTVEGEWNKVAVVTNCNTTSEANVDLSFDSRVKDSTEWVVVANTEEAGLSAIDVVKGKTVTVPASSAMVLVEKTTFDACKISTNSSKIKVISKNIETGEVMSKRVLYGKSGDKYKVAPNSSYDLEYVLEGVNGDEKGTFGTTDRVVTYKYSKYIPASLKKTLTGRKELTVKDATMVQKILNVSFMPTEEQREIADYNMDGDVTIQDVTMIQKYINKDDVGILNKLTVRYLSMETKKVIAPDKTYKVVAGKTDTYEPISIVGYKYNSNSISGVESSVSITHTFENGLLLFYYDDDNYDVTLHVKHSGSLSWTPTLWAWHDAGDIYSAWPGQKMTKDADSNWYTATFKIPNGLSYGVIVSNNGSTQTKDYTGHTESELWAVINDSTVVDKGDFLKFYTSNPDAT